VELKFINDKMGVCRKPEINHIGIRFLSSDQLKAAVLGNYLANFSNMQVVA